MSQPTLLHQLSDAVQRMCTQYGGRVLLLRDGVRVIDCAIWPSRATAWVHLTVGGRVRVAVESSDASLSGFAIVFTLTPPPPHRWPRILLALGALGLAFGAGALLAHQKPLLLLANPLAQLLPRFENCR